MNNTYDIDMSCCAYNMKNIVNNNQDILNDTREHYNHLSIQINKLMKVMETYPQSAQEIMDRLGLKSRVGFRKNYLNPAIEAGIVEMTIPDKPTSKSQMYFKV